MRIFIFNPENDMALALNSMAFTPPVGAMAVRIAGAFIPFWLCDNNDSDFIVVPDHAKDIALTFKESINLRGVPVTSREMKNIVGGCKNETIECLPWGWSKATRTIFRHLGVPEHNLPANCLLDKWRELSGRMAAVKINECFEDWNGSEPSACCSNDAFWTLRERYNDCHTVLKYPWSSSGRGVFFSKTISDEKFCSMALDGIRKYGYVTLERQLDRVMDFGALYYIDNDSPEFRGFSTFSTNSTGNYEGNVIADQTYITELICSRVGRDKLCKAISILTKALTAYFRDAHYSGWIGIDMMIHKSKDGTMDLAPCIELNMRTTMGVIALKINEKTKFDSCEPLLLSQDREVKALQLISDKKMVLNISPFITQPKDIAFFVKRL